MSLDVARERVRQDVKHLQKDFPYNCADPHAPEEYKLAVLGEEVGEVSRAILAAKYGQPDEVNLREELIQVAAVACAWAEALT